MSTVNATYGGFVGHEGVPVLLAVGDEYEADHPLVKARPELFTKPPETKRQEEPKPPSAPPVKRSEPATPAAPAKRGPGRPAGSKNKPKPADG